MKFIGLLFTYSIFFLVPSAMGQGSFEVDTLQTSGGELRITFIGHGTLMFTFNQMVIHIDPVGRYADYTQLPKADIILVTHHHGDHLDPAAMEKIMKPETDLIVNETSYQTLKSGLVMKNGDSKSVRGLEIKAVPAYNLVHKRDNGEPFHPRGMGNGYVITFGETRIYIAGDTENIPEMTDLAGVDCAFLPMNLPYTMSPEMVAAAVKMIRPKILYPYHYGNSDVNQLVDLLRDYPGCEIRIRQMQ